MAVPIATPDGRMAERDLGSTVERFHDMHEELHTYAVREEEPVIRAVRVQTLGRTAKPSLGEYPRVSSPVDAALRSRRPAFFGGRFVETPVYDGDEIGHGHRIEGPAIVEERFTTIVVYPGWLAELDAHGNYLIQREGRST
jgi:N-methylhydantoinase A